MTRLRWPRKRRTLLIFLLALALLALLAGRALASLNKTLLAMAEARARQLVTAELNEALRYVIDASMSDADLVSVTLDERGRVNMLSANAILMDRLAAEAVAHAQARLRETGDQGVLIPLGSALGGVFSGAGPRVRFSIVPVGAVTAGFVTEFEIARQTRELEAGQAVEQWTIEWDNDAQELRKMRSKEDAVDYRYFREPNLMPVLIPDEMIGSIRAEMPELPAEKKLRFKTDFRLPEYDAKLLTADRETADYFEEALEFYQGDPKRVSNWMMNDILRLTHETGLSAADLKIRPADLAEIIRLVDDGTVNSSTGKALIDQVQESGKKPAALVRELGLGMVTDADAIRAVCERVVSENPKEAAAYRAGKETLLGWFTGQVMRQTRGKAEPKLTAEILRELLA